MQYLDALLTLRTFWHRSATKTDYSVPQTRGKQKKENAGMLR